MTLQIRPARPADKDAVFAFCTYTTWGGHDYVLGVWDEWLDDPHGALLVALEAGVPIGVARGVLHTPGEAWLEGMRVDPAHRGSGVATVLSDALLEEMASRGARSARLMTAYENAAVHRLCARLGFTPALRLRHRSRPLEVGSVPGALRALDAEELGAARALLAEEGRLARRGLSFLAVTHNLYSRSGGIWSTWNEERLREHVGRGEVWAWGEAGRPRAIAVVCPHRRRPGVYEGGLLEGPAGACSALLDALVRRETLPDGRPGSPPAVRLFLPLELPRLHRAAAAAGYLFRPEWRGEMWVFERILP